uniref:Uncharacterized protein n=1 Tax=Tanacetum cinerariifolium TaxID=118510 RepID=A0A6L2LZC9_TANCI|nr:hypothetical protein [Tanacetum cinerariifolium]GEV40526.1 hypothetical protein [Tanacetum cinerariifolium]
MGTSSEGNITMQEERLRRGQVKDSVRIKEARSPLQTNDTQALTKCQDSSRPVGADLYLNNDGDADGDDIFKLDIMNEHLVLIASRIPLTECRLFESGGCLLLVGGKGGAHSGHFTIYEKRNDYSQWSLKYIVDLDDIIKPFPTSWSIWSNIFCIVSEEKYSFFVMKLDKKVVKYKIVSKTLTTISYLGPNGNLVSCFQFIPYFANV